MIFIQFKRERNVIVHSLAFSVKYMTKCIKATAFDAHVLTLRYVGTGTVCMC